jgi:hypothetical protein
MPSHAFTASPPDDLLAIKVGAPPPGTTSLAIAFQLIPPPSSGPETVRLLHLRRAGQHLKPAASEVLEVKFNGSTREWIAEFSGFGQKHAKVHPVHMGKVAESPVDVRITVPIGPGEASVAVGPLSAHAAPDLAAVGDLDLLLGFSGPGDLKPPAGWAALWDEGALQWLPGAGSTGSPPPPTPPPGPVLPPVIDPQVGPTPPSAPPAVVTPPPGDPRAAAIALALQLLLPNLPPEEAAIFQPIIQSVTTGGKLNTQTLLLALLPLLLRGGK